MCVRVLCSGEVRKAAHATISGVCLILSTNAIQDSLLKKYNVRLIGVDRAGAGLSTRHTKRTLLDTVDDMRAIADFLDIDKYERERERERERESLCFFFLYM